MNCTLKNRVAEYRAARGIKNWQLARRLGMSRSYVTRIEHEEIQPSLKSALRIARCLGKPVEEIFQLTENGANRLARPARGLEASVGEAPSRSNFPAVPPSTTGNQNNLTENNNEKVS
jgi:putative transcriptional regulator